MEPPDATDRDYTAMMLEHTSVGIAVFDTCELRLRSANTVYLRLLHSFLGEQETIEGYLGRSLSDLSKEVKPLNIMGIFHQVAATGIPYRIEEIALHSPVRGLTYWNGRVDPVFDSVGNVTHLIHTTSEVTEQVIARRAAEEAQLGLSQVNEIVTEERERLKVVATIASSVRASLDTHDIAKTTIETLIAHLSAMGASLYVVDPEKRVLRALYHHDPAGYEESFKMLTSIPYERLTFISDIFSRSTPLVIEDLQAWVADGRVDNDDLLIRSGARGYICVPMRYDEHLEGMLVVLFKRTVRAEGFEVKLLEACGMYVASAIAHGRLHATIERERSRLSTVLDQLPEGILIIEAGNGTISYANPAAARYLGVALEAIVGAPIHHYATSNTFINVIDGRPILPWNFLVVRALSGEAIKGKETLITRPDGSRAFMMASSAPLYMDGRIMTGTVVVFQDITIQKTLEQHRSEFLSIANHELRTPITIIQGFAELLQLRALQGQPLDSLTQYALQSIVDQSQHLIRLIEEMLNLSRIEQGQFTLRCEPTNLVELVTRVIERQSMTNLQHQLRLAMDGVQAGTALIASLDEERIAQALNNLISNAAKYSKPHSDIEVGLRYRQQQPHEALLWVKDEGIGIPQEELSRIFERFYRGKTIDRGTSGFGIGLYLVKEIVSRHNGKIWVESCDGHGSTFSILLPLQSSITAAREPES